MKVVAFILSAYLLILFTVPCCAYDNCREENKSQQTNQGKDNGDCGNCSPFFTCPGCSGFAVSFQENNVEIISSFSGHQYAGYILAIVPDVHCDFWQPPKLV